MNAQNSLPDRYAVIGYPVAHSWSPFIHGMFAQQTGHNLTYSRLEAAPERFIAETTAFFASGGKGLNVTVPHKQAAFAFAHERTARAEMAGAVNTLAAREDGVVGDNTDGVGLITDLRRNLALELAGARILLLGAGGAARGVLAPLLEAGPREIEIANRRADRAVDLANEFAPLGEVHGCGFDEISRTHTFDLVLNATSASLQGAVPAVPPGAIGPATLCYDMAYAKGDTAFTRWAKDAGSERTATGWGMLVEQAAESFMLWRGLRPDTKFVLEVLEAQR
ncbi:MAG TPA: shikimate dehydrogenase [Steroidobacter sp.]|nr:shikimate dehydrogenase [Steroidobacter sp.]